MKNDNDIEKLYPIYLRFKTITTDSRNVPHNSIFFALKGSHFNGNEYALSALDKGAAIAIVDEEKYKINDNCFLVDDVLETLQKLALYHRKKLSIPVIGITGSNGKTTSKELIHAVLAAQYKCKATIGNLNNHIGVPLSILKIDADDDIAIIEMGANHIGEIEELCQIACPSHGIITNIGKAHLEGFLNFENIINTKIALYNYVRKYGHSVFVNADDDLLMSLSENIKRTTYSINNKGDINASTINSDIHLNVLWHNIEIKTHLCGLYNIYNVLAAISVGKFFGVDDEKIVKAITEYIPQNNRSQLIKTNNNTLIMDAYNANPTSMEKALNSFSEMPLTDKVVILGDMLELGSESLNEHKKIIDIIKSNAFEKVFLVGTIFKTANNTDFENFENAEMLKAHLIKHPLKNKSILIKGSRGIKLETILGAL